MKRRLALGILATLALSLWLTPRVSAATPAPPGKYYVALGDSLAYGFQAARIAAEVKATGTVNPADFQTGYVYDFYRMLRAIDPGIQLENFACPGATSSDLVGTQGCPGFPYPLHVPAYNGSTQLRAALEFISSHPGQVNPITINIGPNDANAAIAKCGGLTDLTCLAAAAPEVLSTVGANLAEALTALRKADPTADIIVLNTYNPYAVVAPAASTLVEAFNKALATVATAAGANVADVYTPFNLAPTEPQTLCTLTFYCASKDIHATDAGYLVMAMAVWNASGFAAYAHGFMVGFYGSSPGTGAVYFGPSCAALVEVATQDLLPAGSTAYLIYVTGNDLPSTIGNVAIAPGVTYNYETVILSNDTTTVDNNGGKCYSTTVPKS